MEKRLHEEGAGVGTAVAEWVLPGHPDKLCDALADRIVGEVARIDPYGQCGIEAACAFDRVFVTGLIGFDTARMPDIADRIEGWVRDTYRSAGYGGRWDPLPETLHIDTSALRVEHRGEDWQELRHLSDDQCICVGYAQATPATGFLPGALWTARRIARALYALRAKDPQGPIGPDGKVIVRGDELRDGRFVPRSVSVSLHHAVDADWLQMRRHAQQALRMALGATGVTGDAAPPLPELTLNAAGMFLCGGPTGDNGTTGKKLVMDAYGPGVPVGGGAWSGKDLHKPDRVGGMVARRLAMQCVQAGLGLRVTVRLEYRPNSSAPESVGVWADGRAVKLPAGVQAALTACGPVILSTREAALAMQQLLRTLDHAPLIAGDFARWGHPAAPGAWWEPEGAVRRRLRRRAHPARQLALVHESAAVQRDAEHQQAEDAGDGAGVRQVVQQHLAREEREDQQRGAAEVPIAATDAEPQRRGGEQGPCDSDRQRGVPRGQGGDHRHQVRRVEHDERDLTRHLRADLAVSDIQLEREHASHHGIAQRRRPGVEQPELVEDVDRVHHERDDEEWPKIAAQRRVPESGVGRQRADGERDEGFRP